MKNIISDNLKNGKSIIKDKKSLLQKEISQLPNGVQLAIGCIIGRYNPFREFETKDLLKALKLQ